MSIIATVTKNCPATFVYLVPGRVSLNDRPVFAVSPPAEEEIVVDAMVAKGVSVATYVDPSVTITIRQPAGCEFVMVDPNLRQNDLEWDFPIDDSTVVMRATVNTHQPESLNRGNSRTFRFAIKGRAGNDILCDIVVNAQPVSVSLDSCQWTIDGLGPDTQNLAEPLDESF